MASLMWVNKYKPTKVEDYVFRDDRLKSQVKTWIKEKSFPHILLSGSPGTGKSSLANVLLNEIGVNPGDLLYVNASDATGVDNIRQQVQTFASTIAMGDFKVVLLEEMDFLTQNGQAALRRVLEDNADECRFIMTCNYIHKIIPAIRSRSQEIILQSLDIDAFKIRMVEILLAENIDITDEDILDTYIKAAYPDLRKCIGLMELNTQDGVLLRPNEKEGSTADWQISAIEFFKKGQITNARKLIAAQIRQEEYEEFFRLCYNNLDWFAKTEDEQDAAVLIIRDGLLNHSICADSEINLSATLINLARIGK